MGQEQFKSHIQEYQNFQVKSSLQATNALQLVDSYNKAGYKPNTYSGLLNCFKELRESMRELLRFAETQEIVTLLQDMGSACNLIHHEMQRLLNEDFLSKYQDWYMKNLAMILGPLSKLLDVYRSEAEKLIQIEMQEKMDQKSLEREASSLTNIPVAAAAVSRALLPTDLERESIIAQKISSSGIEKRVPLQECKDFTAKCKEISSSFWLGID